MSQSGSHRKNPQTSAPTRRQVRFRSVLIVVYLVIQLVVPLRGFVHDQLSTRANFTWNMYSQRDGCRAIYAATLDSGEVVEIDHHRFLAHPSRVSLIFHSDVLPRFHEHLCRELRVDGRVARVEGLCLCPVDDREYIPLIEEGVDICEAPNHGVLAR
jgi:hypothetical protein